MKHAHRSERGTGERRAMEKIKRKRTADCGWRPEKSPAQCRPSQGAKRGSRRTPFPEEVKVFSKRDQRDSVPEKSGPRQTPSRSRKRGGTARATGPDDHSDALRLAVETLSAEICWFLAGQPATASGVMDSPPRPPTP